MLFIFILLRKEEKKRKKRNRRALQVLSVEFSRLKTMELLAGFNGANDRIKCRNFLNPLGRVSGAILDIQLAIDNQFACMDVHSRFQYS